MGILITKADGSRESFDRIKLVESLTKAGASLELAHTIATEVESGLTLYAKTADIYKTAFSMLRKKGISAGAAARYAIKRSLFDLGPSGFPFEAYTAELFRAVGYEAATNVIAHGKCVEHEIDVLLKKDGVTTYVEAKFHNTPGFKTDLKVALYVKARIDDLQEKHGPSVRGMILTNTKFTSMATAYGACVNLPLVGWDYPQEENLYNLIQKTGLYPVTALSSLTNREKTELIAQKIVLCRGLPRHADTLRGMGVTHSRLKRLFEEVGDLCGVSAS